MNDNLQSILVAGAHHLFPEIFDHLEAAENYELRYALDTESARALLREYTPDVIVLALPDDPRLMRKALSWIDTVKNLAPVLVLSPVEGTDLYVTAMELGAFDFLLPGTPAEGIEWVLSNALRRDASVAA